MGLAKTGVKITSKLLKNHKKEMIMPVNDGKVEKHDDGNMIVQANTHTEANIDWSALANKISMSNIVKGGLTLGGGYAGSVVGAGLVTGLGFALLGPGGAIIGYHVGNVVGFGAGAVGGHKFGKIVGNELDEKGEKDVIETAKTNVVIDSSKKIDK